MAAFARNIYEGAKTGDARALRTILTANPGFADNYVDRDGDTALGVAVAGRQEEAVALLLAADAKPDRVRHDGESALMVAASHADARIAKLILQTDCTVDLRNPAGETALMKAATAASIPTPNPRAKTVVELLLKAGADPSAVDEDGKSVLVHAATALDSPGAGRAVTALIKAGADPNQQDATGAGALHLASSPEAAEALLRGNAHVDLKTSDGSTPLHVAAREGRTDILRVLLAHADVTLADNAGVTPLAIAQREGHDEAVEMLKTHMQAPLADVLEEGLGGDPTVSQERLKMGLRMALELGYEVDPWASAADAARGLLPKVRCGASSGASDSMEDASAATDGVPSPRPRAWSGKRAYITEEDFPADIAAVDVPPHHLSHPLHGPDNGGMDEEDAEGSWWWDLLTYYGCCAASCLAYVGYPNGAAALQDESEA